MLLRPGQTPEPLVSSSADAPTVQLDPPWMQEEEGNIWPELLSTRTPSRTLEVMDRLVP